MPVISVRFRPDEVKLLRKLRAERGCTSHAALVRQALGLDLDQGESRGDYDELESFAEVANLQVKTIDRLDDIYRTLKRMAKHLGMRGLNTDEGDAGAPITPKTPRRGAEDVAGDQGFLR